MKQLFVEDELVAMQPCARSDIARAGPDTGAIVHRIRKIREILAAERRRLIRIADGIAVERIGAYPSSS